MTALGTKVSMLTVALVLGVPLFNIGRYPEEDLSLKAWSCTLEASYAEACTDLFDNPSKTSSDIFQKSIDEMNAFYDNLDYFPFMLWGYDAKQIVGGRDVAIPGAFQKETSVRLQNILRQA